MRPSKSAFFLTLHPSFRNIPDSYVAADEMEIGFGNKIPLWLFGMM